MTVLFQQTPGLGGVGCRELVIGTLIMSGRQTQEADMTVSQALLIAIGVLYVLHAVAEIYEW